MGAAAIIQLISLAIPAGLQIFTLIHDPATGTNALIVSLNAADTANAATLQAIAAWQAAHPTATTPAAPPPIPGA